MNLLIEEDMKFLQRSRGMSQWGKSLESGMVGQFQGLSGTLAVMYQEWLQHWVLSGLGQCVEILDLSWFCQKLVGKPGYYSGECKEHLAGDIGPCSTQTMYCTCLYEYSFIHVLYM